MSIYMHKGLIEWSTFTTCQTLQSTVILFLSCIVAYIFSLKLYLYCKIQKERVKVVWVLYNCMMCVVGCINILYYKAIFVLHCQHLCGKSHVYFVQLSSIILFYVCSIIASWNRFKRAYPKKLFNMFSD